jgi:hypothetical protein
VKTQTSHTFKKRRINKKFISVEVREIKMKITKMHAGILGVVLIGGGLVLWHLLQQTTSPAEDSNLRLAISNTAPRPKEAPPETTPANRPKVDPLFGLDGVLIQFETATNQDHMTKLALFELSMKEKVSQGWKPPWSELDIALDDEEVRKLPTEELGRMLLTSGLPARTLLLYEDPHLGVKRLEALHKGYKELFQREDFWKAPVAAIHTWSSQLDPTKDNMTNVGVMVGFTALPTLYSYPTLSKKIEGHERELIAAHIQGLKQVASFVAASNNKTAADGSPAFFSATAPASLVTSALALGKKVNQQQFENAKTALSATQWPDQYTPNDVKHYVERAVDQLEPFVR